MAENKSDQNPFLIDIIRTQQKAIDAYESVMKYVKVSEEVVAELRLMRGEIEAIKKLGDFCAQKSNIKLEKK